MSIPIIEFDILHAIQNLLTGAVNRFLEEQEYDTPLIELGGGAPDRVVPEIRIVGGERSEKDRVIRLDVFSVTITLRVPEENGERSCYTYAAGIDRAISRDPTLGGVIDQAAMIKRSYQGPKVQHIGEGWEAVFTLWLTIEGAAR
jgi:hypothetical protein